MRVTVIYNPTSGDEDHTAETLLSAIRSEGHQPTYRSSKDSGWREVLDQPAELVVAAGGDGTVDKVAPLLAERGIPLAVLPLGTANNFADALGISGDWRELISGWSNAVRKPLDLSLATGPWGRTMFTEAAGVGLFPQTMPLLSALAKARPLGSGDGKLDYDLRLLASLLPKCQARPWTLMVDGQDCSGDYLLMEVMNIPTLGPDLRLAPEAEPGDGLSRW